MFHWSEPRWKLQRQRFLHLGWLILPTTFPHSGLQGDFPGMDLLVPLWGLWRIKVLSSKEPGKQSSQWS
jgi:hypothetical protein